MTMRDEVKNLRRNGSADWIGRCPICGGRDSLRINGRKPERWTCPNCTPGRWAVEREYTDWRKRKKGR